MHLPRYLSLPTRKERQVLIASVLQEIVSDGGRFLERKGNRWVTLTRAQAHRKVGHALRDAALRVSIRNSKIENADGTMENLAWEDRPCKSQKTALFDEELSCINLGWDGNTDDHRQQPPLILQKDVLGALQELKAPRPSSPDWTLHLNSYVNEMAKIDFDCASLISFHAGEMDDFDQNDFLLEMPI